MRNQRTLSHNLIWQQTTRFGLSPDSTNGLFHAFVKFYVSKMTPFDTTQRSVFMALHENLCVRNALFSFCSANVLAEKDCSMLLGKFMWQSQSDAVRH
jgi:hypothetical protein